MRLPFTEFVGGYPSMGIEAKAASGQKVIKGHARLDQRAGVTAEPGAGKKEAPGLHQVGCLAQELCPLPDGVANETEVVGFQVAQTAVEELGGICAGSLAEITGFENGHLEPVESRLTGQGRTVDAASDDYEIETQSLRSFSIGSCSRLGEGSRTTSPGSIFLTFLPNLSNQPYGLPPFRNQAHMMLMPNRLSSLLFAVSLIAAAAPVAAEEKAAPASPVPAVAAPAKAAPAVEPPAAAPVAQAAEAPAAAPSAPAAEATPSAPATPAAKTRKVKSAAAGKSGSKSPASLDPTSVVITVGPNKIRKSQIDQLVTQMAKANPTPRVLDEREKTAMAAMIATNLIGQELLELEGKRLAVAAPESEIDSMYRMLKANFPDEATWRRMLKEGGNTDKSFKEKLGRQIKADKILNAQVPQVDRSTNKEILDFFAANKAKFPVNDSLRAGQIVLLAGKDVGAMDVAKKKADLEKVRAELAKDSADPDRLLARFMMAARQVSEGPEKNAGGDLQRFHPNDFSPDFKKPLTSLRVGQLSPVFKTQLGWHLVLLMEKFDGKPDSYRYLIARTLATEKAAAAGKTLRKYLVGLAAKYKVNYLESAYRDTSPTGVYNL